jgi:hypothetical protein
VNNLAEIYLKAAQVIESNGHAKGDFYNIPESSYGISLGRCEWPVCALGALSIAVFGDPYPPRENQDGHTEFAAIAARLNARIDFNAEPQVEPMVRIANWNDAEERTAADVIAVFERTAREVAA